MSMDVEKEQRRFWSDDPLELHGPPEASSPNASLLSQGTLVLTAPIAFS